jgi:hypothetical protein
MPDVIDALCNLLFLPFYATVHGEMQEKLKVGDVCFVAAKSSHFRLTPQNSLLSPPHCHALKARHGFDRAAGWASCGGAGGDNLDEGCGGLGDKAAAADLYQLSPTGGALFVPGTGTRSIDQPGRVNQDPLLCDHFYKKQIALAHAAEAAASAPLEGELYST